MDFKKFIRKMVPQVGLRNELNRQGWIKETLEAIPSGSRILDAGAGTQQYRKHCKHLNYVSQDFAQYNGTGDNIGLQTGDWDYGKLDIISDIVSIPEPDSSFDIILCAEVFEHLADPVKAVKEFSRLLKPGGQLIITAPFCSLTHFAPFHFSTGFNTYWYKHHLEDSGFEGIQLYPNGNFFEYIGQEIYRIPSVSNRFAHCKPRIYELICMFILEKMLLRFSKRDKGSSELLCYGYHVRAQKAHLI